jgi:hypothetical protein
VNFEAFLISKKIDSNAFQSAEKHVFDQWRTEFEQMHPSSFTVQKLNLINPIRRKYPLKMPAENPAATSAEVTAPKPAAKPMIRPKPKMN